MSDAEAALWSTLAGPVDRALFLRVAAAVVCGGLVGLERQMRGKPIGIRTGILICLATASFVELGVAVQGTRGDPTRVLGQVVTGVGFLGAGVILSRGGEVIGVTSASVVWLLAAIGSAIGLGRLGEAVTLALAAVGLLTGVRLLERAFWRLRGGSDEPETRSPEQLEH